MAALRYDQHLYDKDETRVCRVCIDQNACSNQLVHCQSRNNYLQAESRPVKHLAKQKAHLGGIAISQWSFWRQKKSNLGRSSVV